MRARRCNVAHFFKNHVCDDYVILLVTFFVANQIVLQNISQKKNYDCPIGQVLELFYLPKDIFRLPGASGQALVSNTDPIQGGVEVLLVASCQSNQR